jgi:hypothetical protein
MFDGCAMIAKAFPFCISNLDRYGPHRDDLMNVPLATDVSMGDLP